MGERDENSDRYKNVRVLKRFDSKIGRVDEDQQFQHLLENIPLIEETDIDKIEKYAKETNKNILNCTQMNEEEKGIVEYVNINKIHVKVEFIFHGYWETESNIVMLTSIKSIEE